MESKTYQPTIIIHEDESLLQVLARTPYSGKFYSEYDFDSVLAERDQLREDLDSVITQAWQQLWKVARQGTAFERQRDQLREELDKATRALTSAGYTLLEGAQEWKPPIGPSSTPLLDLIDALRAELEVKQNGI